MELSQLLSVAWKRRWVLLAVLVAAGVASTAFALSRPKQYESTAVLALTPSPQQGQGLLSADNLNALMRTYAETAKAAVTRDRAEKILGQSLPGPVATSVEAGTGILRIGVRARHPNEAAAAATAVELAFRESIADNHLLDATVVTPPEPATSAVAPRPPLIIGAALVVGLLCGLLLAFALENLRRRIVTAADVAEHTAAPVVGRLPRERALARRKTVTAWDIQGSHPLKEGYRAMRTNLEFLLGDELHCIQVTSPEEGQGKSVVVASLGIAFAQVGIQTVIVDADLRQPSQHLLFGLDNETGLSSALALGQELELTPSREQDLWVVTSGPIIADPTEMLHIRFRSVIDELRELDALILIDTPPILPVSDARLVASAVDGVLMVVEAGRQKPVRLQSALEKLALVNARLLGVVLNHSEEEALAGRYGAYGEPVVDLASRRTLLSDANGPLPARRAQEPRPGESP